MIRFLDLIRCFSAGPALLAIPLLLVPPPVHSEDAPAATEQTKYAEQAESRCPDAEELGFLRGLNQDRQYSLAAFQAEIDRRAPGCPPSPEFDLELARALYQLGDFARVRGLLRPHLGRSDAAYRRYWAEAHLLDFSRPDAWDSLAAFAGSADGSHAAGPAAGLPEDDRRLFLAGALYLKDDVMGARKAWPRGAEGYPDCPDPDEPWCRLQGGLRSPGLAAGLSLAPGLGYAYAGQTGDGIFAFTVVSLFYGLAAYYSQYGSPARAWTFAGFGAVFHASNIYGAHRSAQAANKRIKTGFLVALHRKLFP